MQEGLRDSIFPAYCCSIHINQFGPHEDGHRTSLQNFLADYVGQGEVLLQELWFSPVSIIPQIPQADSSTSATT